MFFGIEGMKVLRKVEELTEALANEKEGRGKES